MIQRTNWQAYTNGDRNTVIEQIKETILFSDGYIVNFKMFSDIALSINVEIAENKLLMLHQALGGIVRISNFEDEGINSKSLKEWIVYLHISFSSGTGNLKIEVPQIPG